MTSLTSRLGWFRGHFMGSGLRDGIQTFLSEAGESACYAIDIVKIAERITGKEFDLLKALQLGIEERDIYFYLERPDDNNNFFVEHPDLFLSRLVGAPWKLEKVEDTKYIPKTGEYVVQRWERKTTSGFYSHFRLPDWDSLVNSKTVEFGALVSLRVFRKV